MLGQPPLGQDLHFERYIAPRLAKCGCVVIFFGGRWSLLFSHPAGIQANHFDRRQVASFRQLCLRRPPTLSTRPAITSRFLMRVISQSDVAPTSSRSTARRGHVFRRVLAAELIQTGSSADAARACSDAAAALVTHLRTTVSASKADEPGAFNDAFQRFSMQSLVSGLFGQFDRLLRRKSTQSPSTSCSGEATHLRPFLPDFPRPRPVAVDLPFSLTGQRSPADSRA